MVSEKVHISHCLLNDGAGSDSEVVVDQPHWHTHVEQLIADPGVCGKTAHPFRADRARNRGWIANMREDIKGIVKECHYVQKVLLYLSHEYNYVMEGERVIENDHEIMV